MRERGDTIGGFDKQMLKVVGPGTILFMALLSYLLWFSNASFEEILVVGIAVIITLAIVATLYTRERVTYK